MYSALITGCYGDIGQDLVGAFRDAGYKVIGSDLEQRDVATEPDDFVALDLLDVANERADKSEFAAMLLAACTDAPLHVLVNNAAKQSLGRLNDLNAADFRDSLAVNAVAPAVLSQWLSGDLAANNGSIVNIGSIHAELTKPEFSAYATSKAALRGLTQALAVELGSQVRCNLIEPAAVATPMLQAGFENDEQSFATLAGYHPVGRIGQVDEIAALAVFLASAQAGFINGAVFGIDGGIRHRLHDPT